LWQDRAVPTSVTFQPLDCAGFRTLSPMMISTTISAAQHAYEFAPESWKGRVVLITGATGGLGAALAHRFAAAGATVILMGRHLGRLETIYDELVAAGAPEPAMIEQDFTKTTPEILQGTADVIQQNFARLDALVHTAATLGTLTPLQLIDDDEWRRAFDVNVHAARDLTMACLPLQTTAYWGGYGVSKAALQALSAMFADETDSAKDANQHPLVAVHAVRPGPMRTRLRRRAFSGELEEESPLPETRLGAFMWLLDRVEPNASGHLLIDQAAQQP